MSQKLYFHNVFCRSDAQVQKLFASFGATSAKIIDSNGLYYQVKFANAEQAFAAQQGITLTAETPKEMPTLVSKSAAIFTKPPMTLQQVHYLLHAFPCDIDQKQDSPFYTVTFRDLSIAFDAFAKLKCFTVHKRTVIPSMVKKNAEEQYKTIIASATSTTAPPVKVATMVETNNASIVKQVRETLIPNYEQQSQLCVIVDTNVFLSAHGMKILSWLLTLPNATIVMPKMVFYELDGLKKHSISDVAKFAIWWVKSLHTLPVVVQGEHDTVPLSKSELAFTKNEKKNDFYIVNCAVYYAQHPEKIPLPPTVTTTKRTVVFFSFDNWCSQQARLKGVQVVDKHQLKQLLK